MSICPSSVRLSVCLSVFVCLPVSLPDCLSVCRSVCLSFCLSVIPPDKIKNKCGKKQVWSHELCTSSTITKNVINIKKSNSTINLKVAKVIKRKSAVDFFSNCGAYYEIIISIIDLISLFLFSFSLN